MDRRLQKHDGMASKTPLYAVEEYNSGATYKRATPGFKKIKWTKYISCFQIFHTTTIHHSNRISIHIIQDKFENRALNEVWNVAAVIPVDRVVKLNSCNRKSSEYRDLL
ncbi:hypothetical protein Tco_1563690 [Tanacetum coccineum]